MESTQLNSDRLRLALVAAVVIVVSAITSFTAVAHAGTYVISNGPATANPNNDPGPWVVFGSPQGGKASWDGTGDWIGPRGTTMVSGSNAGVELATPPGIAVEEATVWWAAPTSTSGNTSFTYVGANGDAIAERVSPRGTEQSETYHLPLSTTSFVLTNYCTTETSSGCTFGSGLDPILELYGSQITLGEDTPPNGEVTGGSLTRPEVLAGEQVVSYHVEDGGSGVRLVQLIVDGHVATSEDYGAQCPYTNYAACPTTQSGALTWNTASVSDGHHVVEVKAEDAAHNSSVLYADTVSTDNSTPGSPPTKLLETGAPSGSPTDGGFSQSTSVLPGADLTNGLPASSTANIHLMGEATVNRGYMNRALDVAGRLETPGRTPISNAVLVITQRLAGSNETEQLGHVTTSSAGSFVAKLRPGPSRQITFSYRAFPSETRYTAQTTIRENVRPDITLGVTPVHIEPSGTVTFYGRVAGPLPRRGVILDVLVYYRHRWRPIPAPRANASGRFRFKYRFEGAIGTFPFRVLVPAGQAGFPYSGGYSRAVSVISN